MVTTVTLNPMLDKTIYIDRLRPGEITRASKREMVPGGKGINVARQLTRFGVEAVATGFMGREIGRIVEQLLDGEAVKHDFVHIRDFTREGITIVETESGRSTGIFEPPHMLEKEEIDRLREKCHELLQLSEWLVLSGSTPTAHLDCFYSDFISKAHSLSKKSVLDTYGIALQNGLKAKPFMIKPNLREYEQTFGTKLSSEQSVLEELTKLEEAGIPFVALTDTDKPFFVSYLGQRWRVMPPEVTTVNSTGSGDAFVAGTIYGFMQDWDIEKTLRFATAAGAVNASRWAVVDVSFSEAEHLAPKVKLEQI